jgi:tRNA 2-selenouridine synthase
MRDPVRVTDRHRFDTIIDARTPAEFAIDHVPGAINCPTLTNEQRVIIGTLYKQVGSFEAKRLGAAMVAENLAKHLREAFADKPANWKPLIYCWRGGLRSGSMTQWLRLVGWDAQQLQGGYKAWRRYVIEMIARIAPSLDLRVVVGATGSAKTRVLQALVDQGHQAIDLEGLACHKGSVLGTMPGTPQPSQIRFETLISEFLETVDVKRPVYVEGESRKIGRLTVPEPLLACMRASPCIEINATNEARLAYLLRDYAYLGDDRTLLADKLALLKDLHGKAVINQWQDWAMQGQLAPLFEALMISHYDPHYVRSQSKNYVGWEKRQSLPCDSLSPEGIAALAQAVAACKRPAA